MIILGPLSVAGIFAGVFYFFGLMPALVLQFTATLITLALLIMTMPPDLSFKWNHLPRAFAEVFFTWPFRLYDVLHYIAKS